MTFKYSLKPEPPLLQGPKILSPSAPIILTWIPREYGKTVIGVKDTRTQIEYLDIIKNHKQEKEETRDMYLVINGQGLKAEQIKEIINYFKEVDGIHVINLDKCSWKNIDKGWELDGKEISIQQYYQRMYGNNNPDMDNNDLEFKRMPFFVEIDTFRLIALSLIEEIRYQNEKGEKEEERDKDLSAIYIDFDTLLASNNRIYPHIKIEKDFLLRGIFTNLISDSKDRLSDEEYIDNIIPDKVRLLGASDNSYSQSLEKEPLITELHNDLIVIKRPTIIINMLNGFKHKLKSEEKITDELDKLFSSCEKFGDNIKDYMQNHGSNDNEGEQNDSEDARDESEDEKDHNKENLFSKNEIYKLLLGEYINVEDTKFKEKIFKNRLNNLFKMSAQITTKEDRAQKIRSMINNAMCINGKSCIFNTNPAQEILLSTIMKNTKTVQSLKFYSFCGNSANKISMSTHDHSWKISNNNSIPPSSSHSFADVIAHSNSHNFSNSIEHSVDHKSFRERCHSCKHEGKWCECVGISHKSSIVERVIKNSHELDR